MDDGGNSACSTWFDSRRALLNSSSSTVSHSSSNVGVSGEQYPRRRAQSITELMRWRSDAWVKPCHALAAYVIQATTVAWCIDVLQSRIVQSVTAQHSWTISWVSVMTRSSKWGVSIPLALVADCTCWVKKFFAVYIETYHKSYIDFWYRILKPNLCERNKKITHKNFFITKFVTYWIN